MQRGTPPLAPQRDAAAERVQLRQQRQQRDEYQSRHRRIVAELVVTVWHDHVVHHHDPNEAPVTKYRVISFVLTACKASTWS